MPISIDPQEEIEFQMGDFHPTQMNSTVYSIVVYEPAKARSETSASRRNPVTSVEYWEDERIVQNRRGAPQTERAPLHQSVIAVLLWVHIH